MCGRIFGRFCLCAEYPVQAGKRYDGILIHLRQGVTAKIDIVLFNAIGVVGNRACFPRWRPQSWPKES